MKFECDPFLQHQHINEIVIILNIFLIFVEEDFIIGGNLVKIKYVKNSEKKVW